MTADVARRAAELLEGVTRGPVGWYGNKHGIYLATKHRGRQYVMGFRRFGMNGAQPVFNVDSILVPAADLVTFEVGDKVSVGFDAAKEDESVYRYDVSGIDHPDARFIAECFELVPALLAERAALVEALADTLKMVEAAHRQIGIYSKDNPRIVKARALLKGAPDV